MKDMTPVWTRCQSGAKIKGGFTSMSIEALWSIDFTGVNDDSIAKSGGVVVFETGRVFGGDTWQLYTGGYSRADDGRLKIEIATDVHHMDGGQSIFGGPLRAMQLSGFAQVMADQNAMFVTLEVVGQSKMWLAATLKRVAELPNP
jgi:hypothetical protein